MSKEIYISSTPHETRLAIVEHDALTEIYYERENEYTLAGSIYNGKVTRVLPGMQSSFVDIGLERDAFLYITDFMEEAGDSADFEASANLGDHAPRAPRQIEGNRSEGNRSEGRSEGRGDRGNRDRNDRGNREQRPAAEPTDADLFASAVSSLDPARPVAEPGRADSDRSERGGNRRGGRNRRDRNTNSDGTPRAPRPETPQPEAAATPVIIPHPDHEEVGEGAPGADGSRRWRGRRGRRGNRGNREDAGQPLAEAGATQSAADIAPDSTPASTPVRNTGPVENAYGDTLAELNELEQESQAGLTPLSAPDEAPIPWDDTRPRTPRAERGGRGRRDRGADRGQERGQDRSTQQPPRVPRGFAPSTSLYQVEGAAEESTPYGLETVEEAPIEPMILPGESLGKYRPGGSTPAETRAEVTPVPAAPAFIVSGWDGGAVLPGETIRPRGPVADSSAPREDRGRNRDDRGGRNRDDRGGRSARGPENDRAPRPDRQPDVSPDREDVRSEAYASQQVRPAIAPYLQASAAPESFEPADIEQSEPEQFQLPTAEAPVEALVETKPETESEQQPSPSEPTYLSSPETMPASHLITPIHSTFVPPPPLPEPAAAASDARPEPEPEFEPIEASASYRVDPIVPREYRMASPAEPPSLETAAFAEPEAQASEPVSEHLEFAPVETDPADLHTVSAGLRQALEHTEGPDSAQITSISDTGNMHSEPLPETPETTHELPAIEEPEPASPIAHEFAVVLPASELAASFAPGNGLLEEEEFFDDEEESTPVDLHAAVSAHEEHEQETLEGAADLGTMLREMSIDQITRTEPALDEDEEDDFLEEDQDYEDSGDSDDDLSEPEGTEDADEHDQPAEGLDEVENSEYGSGFEGERPAAAAGTEPRREPRSRDERNRRDGRGRNDRNRRSSSDRGDRGDRSSGGFSSPGADRYGSDRPAPSRTSSADSGGRRDHRGGRNSMQTTNLPAISDLLKPGQELLCQIAKEPIAKKGARITSHIALPGRFLVFMPTVNHTGVSRKIESDGERRRLKEILLSEKGEAAGGFIVRTAAAGATEEELRSDLRFLLNLWADIKTRSESSKSPALIYHDLNLVERVLRDQVTDTFSAIWVDTESEYERVLRFLQRFQPSLIRRVKLYTKETPLFEQFGITEEINKALRSKVWLKSGGSIVINQTEALVAIDINTGKFVGKTARLEDTIVKTNLDAIPEIVRQIRLRDLGGIIIIDFIDMDERKNRNKVMAALEEELKTDRAPSKVLQFNDFGLVAITRKRVKQSLERTLSTTCGICAGTGMVKSPVTVCNDIYIEMRKMHKHLDRGDVMLRVNPEVVKQLKSTTSRWLQEMEEMVGKTILVKSDPSLHPEQFDIH